MGIFRRKPPLTHWQAKQKLAAPSRFYGNGGTIHGNGTLDIVKDKDGHVTEVWFRCQQLPFRVRMRGERTGYGSTDPNLPVITGVEVLDPPLHYED